MVNTMRVAALVNWLIFFVFLIALITLSFLITPI